MFVPVHVNMLEVLIHLTLKTESSDLSYKQIAIGHKNDVYY